MSARISAKAVPSSFSIGNYTYTVSSQNTVTISPVNKSTITSASIPSTVSYEGTPLPITALDFSNCPKLQTVTLSSTYITSIPWNGFANCTSLSYINLSATNITEIGYGAFSNCTSLRAIALPKRLTQIGAEAFSNCKILNYLALPETLKTIGRNFMNNTAITSITIPASVTNIYDGSFENDNLEEIIVESDNKYFKSENGVLYSTQWKKYLIKYPDAKRDTEFTLDYDCTYYAFNNPKYLQKLTIDGWYIQRYSNVTFSNGYPDTDESTDVTNLIIKGKNITDIFIGEKCEIDPLHKKDLPNLKNVEIADGNVYYKMNDGLIYRNGYDYNINKSVKELWLVTPQASDIKSYTGRICNDGAFEWCDKITEIFDFSGFIGSYRYGSGGPDISHLDHTLTYYAYPVQKSSMGYMLFNTGYDNSNYHKPTVVFLANIQNAYYYDGDEDNNRNLIGNFEAVYGPKGGKIKSLLYRPNLYMGDLNIVTVNAAEDIQESVSINGHRTHVFGVSDNEPVSVSFNSLPENTLVFANGVDMTSQMHGGVLSLSSVSQNYSITLKTLTYLTVDADSTESTVYIDGIKQSSVVNDAAHTVHIVPHDGYYISSLTLNGEDVMDQLTNKYITLQAAEANQTLEVGLLADKDSRLTIESGDLKVAHYFNVGDRVLVSLMPQSGKRVNTVHFNGEDVTSDVNADNHYQTPKLSGDDTLTVTYADDTVTDLSAATATAPLIVYPRGNSIIIKGKNADTEVVVYDVNGSELRRTSESMISGLANGVYLLNIGAKDVFKIAL